MSKQLQAATIAAPGFQGLNTQDSSVTLESGFALVANNCVIDKFGRIGARKGWTTVHPTNTDLSTGSVKTIHQCRAPDNTTVLFVAGNNKLFIEEAGSLVAKNVRNAADDANVTYTISDSHWQVANIQQSGETKAYATVVQAGHPVLILNYLTSAYGFQRLGDIGQLPDTYTTTTFTPNCALAAYGRTWLADIEGDRQTVYFSDLVDANNYKTGTAGRLNISEVVGDGDPITGLAAHNGFLVIFCERHIVLYSQAQDPTALSLTDTVNGIGCIARDSIQATGSDVVFLSESGVRSVARTIQEKSAPLKDISKNVRDDLLVDVGLETRKNIKSIYSPLDAFYLISFPTATTVYCFDTRAALPDGALRATTWSLAPTAFALTISQEVYMGFPGYVGKYNSYQDNSINYTMSYYTNYFDYQTPTQIKMLKKIDFYLIGGAGQDISFKWDFDYTGSYYASQIELDAASVSEYGIDEYNIATYSGGIVISLVNLSASGSGRVLQVGLESEINNNPLSVQKLDVYVKPGRIA